MTLRATWLGTIALAVLVDLLLNGFCLMRNGKPGRERFTEAYRASVLEFQVADRVCVNPLRSGFVLLARLAFQACSYRPLEHLSI